MIRPCVAALCLASVLTLAACGASSTDSAPVSAGTPAATKSSVPLVPHDQLAALLPVIDGWQRGEISSGSISLPAPATNATTAYTREKARVDLEITDTGGAAEHIEALTKVAGSDFTQQASNGYMKGTTLAGFPAVESWNHVDHLGDITLLIDQRYVVHANATGLDKIETLRELIQKVPTTFAAKR